MANWDFYDQQVAKRRARRRKQSYIGRSAHKFHVELSLGGGWSLTKYVWATTYENARRYAIRKARREGYDVEA